MTDLFANTDPELLEKFKTFHRRNPFVYKTFREYATRIRNSGHAKYSAVTIVNVIRWERDLATTTGDAFQINNDFIAIYARLLIHHDPSFAKFFELRSMKPTRRKISREESNRLKHISGPITD